MKLFTATLGVETNTFAPLPTNLDAFSELHYHAGVDIARGASPLPPAGKALTALGQNEDVEIRHGLYAAAQPGGITTRQTYEHLRQQLLGDIRTAGAIDGMLLNLHGAMIADGYLDCEGDLLEHVRKAVGPQTPICVVLDPHCHLSEAMLRNTDAISCYKEYPHTDVEESLFKMARLLHRIVEGRCRPTQSVFDCRMISILHTTEEPVRSIVARIRHIENTDPEVLSISIVHGFPWGDSPDLGTKVLIVTDSAPQKGAKLAQEIGAELFRHRHAYGNKVLSMSDAVDRADAACAHPVVIADSSDNPGGGAPSDSMRLVKALMARGVRNAAAAFIWDAGAVAIAHRAGEGARLALRIGAKTTPLSGDPLDIEVVVRRLAPNIAQEFAGLTWNAGPCAMVEGGGFELVLTTNRIQCFTPAAFSQAGIAPESKSMLVVKSSQHFRNAFEPIASDILYAEPPGVLNTDLAALPFRHVKRPRWPFDQNPFE